MFVGILTFSSVMLLALLWGASILIDDAVGEGLLRWAVLALLKKLDWSC